MKNRISFILSIALAIALFSCSPQERDLFSASSASRMDAALKSEQSILTGAKNGWLMQYYPEKTQKYGGYNVLASFSDDGKVVIASEIDDPTATATSTYLLSQSAGVLLSFDSYNTIFHVFSDPTAAVSGVGTNGKGMEGDFEFKIQKATVDSVIMIGRKTNNRIVMTPIPVGKAWADVINAIGAEAELMPFLMYTYQINGKNIPVTVSYRTLTFKTDTADVKVAFIQTAKGFKFYEPFTIEKIKVTEFIFNPSDGAYGSFTPVDGAAAKLVPKLTPLSDQLQNSNWYTSFSRLGTTGQTYWTQAKAMAAAQGETMGYTYIGKYNATHGFYFKSGVYAGIISLIYTKVSDTEVKMSWTTTQPDGNGAWYLNNAQYHYFTDPFATSTTSRNFTLTSDNIISPNWILMTDKADANNTIRLTKSAVAPF